jgi:hypothetical protein
LGTNGLSRFFGVQPTTLICPGDQWTDAALETALDIGLDLVGSYYLALRDGDRFCWATHICAPYLDEPADQWFDSGLPVVGYFHDRDPAIKGIGWVSEWLNRWGAVGARRMIDFREFAGAVMRPLELTVSEENLHLRFVDGRAPDLVRAPRIRIYAPAGNLPSQLAVFVGAQTCRLAVRHETGTEAELVPHIGDLHGHRRLVG